MPADEVARIGIDLCRALAAIHRAGLLHRDLKAQNVLRDRDGRVLVTDFGAGLDADRADARPASRRARRSTSRQRYPEAAAPRSERHLRPRRPVVPPVDARLSRDGSIPRGHSRRASRGRSPVACPRAADLDATMVQAIERALEPQPGTRYAQRERDGRRVDGLRRRAAAAASAAPGNAVAAPCRRCPVLDSSSLLVQKLWSASVVDAEAVSPVTPRKVLLPAGRNRSAVPGRSHRCLHRYRTSGRRSGISSRAAR